MDTSLYYIYFTSTATIVGCQWTRTAPQARREPHLRTVSNGSPSDGVTEG